MKTKRISSLLVLTVSIFTIGLAQPAVVTFARNSDRDSRDDSAEFEAEHSENETEVEHEEENEVEKRHDSDDSGVDDEIKVQQKLEEKRLKIEARAEERTQELVNRVEAKRAKVTEKLKSKRLEMCEERASKVNEIIAKSTEYSTRHLEVFRKIADRTQAYYTKKQLQVTNYDGLVAAMNSKETEAIAALEAAKTITFVCDEQDANDVGNVVRDAVRTQHSALKDYRSAIKDLIVAIKPAAQAYEDKAIRNESSDDSTQNQPNSSAQQ
jgi:hypothetical protein